MVTSTICIRVNFLVLNFLLTEVLHLQGAKTPNCPSFIWEMKRWNNVPRLLQWFVSVKTGTLVSGDHSFIYNICLSLFEIKKINFLQHTPFSPVSSTKTRLYSNNTRFYGSRNIFMLGDGVVSRKQFRYLWRIMCLHNIRISWRKFLGMESLWTKTNKTNILTSMYESQSLHWIFFLL